MKMAEAGLGNGDGGEAKASESIYDDSSDIKDPLGPPGNIYDEPTGLKGTAGGDVSFFNEGAVERELEEEANL